MNAGYCECCLTCKLLLGCLVLLISKKNRQGVYESGVDITICCSQRLEHVRVEVGSGPNRTKCEFTLDFWQNNNVSLFGRLKIARHG